MTVHRTLERVRGEFLEMPGLHLTAAQVERLCGMEPAVCRTVLAALVDARFLRIGPDGRYTRLTDGELHVPGRLRSCTSWDELDRLPDFRHR